MSPFVTSVRPCIVQARQLPGGSSERRRPVRDDVHAIIRRTLTPTPDRTPSTVPAWIGGCLLAVAVVLLLEHARPLLLPVTVAIVFTFVLSAPVRALRRAGARLRDVPRHPGLHGLLGYASRGLIWAPLMAELLVSQLENAPPPLESVLVDALDPGRFLLKQRRRSQ